MGRLGIAGIWGLGGTLLVLVDALYRLIPYALEPFSRRDLGPLEWAAFAGSVVALAVGEGYRGFQRSFSPRAVARAFALADRPAWIKLMAPLYVMALIYARPRRLVVNWCLVAMIVTLVLWVRTLPYPWRSIVDGGVVAGLGWGTASLLWLLVRGLRGTLGPVDLEHPGTPPPPLQPLKAVPPQTAR